MKFNPKSLLLSNKDIKYIRSNINGKIKSLSESNDAKSIEELQSLIQNEVAVTITQFINPKLVSIDGVNDKSEVSKSSEFVMNNVINTIGDIRTIINRSDKHIIELYIKLINTCTQMIDTHMDDEGNDFRDLISLPDTDKVMKIGTIAQDESGQWMVRIDKSLSPQYVDIEMYTKCWLCHDDKVIRNFLNDIFMRVNKLGQYSDTASTSLLRESNDPDPLIVPEPYNDDSTYEIEYDPDQIIVYIHENLEKDLDLTEETEEDRTMKIKDFFESLPGVSEFRLSESFGKAFLIGFAVPHAINLVNNVFKSAKITPRNNTSQYVSMMKASHQAALAARRRK